MPPITLISMLVFTKCGFLGVRRFGRFPYLPLLDCDSRGWKVVFRGEAFAKGPSLAGFSFLPSPRPACRKFREKSV
jgi:hypothetical protein